MSPTARIGPIEMTGLDGPTMIASAAAIASRTSGVASASPMPRSSVAEIGASAPARMRYSCTDIQRSPQRTRVRTGSSAIGRTRAFRPRDAPSSASVSVRRAPSARRRWRLDRDREVAVAEGEPDVDAEIAQRVHDREAVVAQPPAALVDEVGEPERAQVGVGADVGAVDLDVVGGVGDDREILADDVEHPARELRPTGAAREHDDRRHQPATAGPQLVGQARDLDAGVRLVADVDRDHERGELLGEARHLQAAAVDAAQPVDGVQQRRHAGLVGARVAREQDVLVEDAVEIAQRRGADRVQRADDGRRPRGPSPAPAAPPSPARRRPCGSPCRRSPRRAGPLRRSTICPGRSASRRLCSVSAWLRNGTARMTSSHAAAASAFSAQSNLPAGTAARARTTVSPARWGSREPRTTSPPARASRTARPKPRAPEAPMMETGSGKR